ncbi:MAG: rhomboid family intramembrane serine protease [Luteolibacter sp.]
MTETEHETPDTPVWARPDAFPPAPQGWGWVDGKNHVHCRGSLEELHHAIRNDSSGTIDLAWTPDHDRMVLPEEIPGASAPIRAAREVWTRQDLEDTTKRLSWTGIAFLGFAAYTFSQHWQQTAHLARQSGTDFNWLEPLRDTLKTPWLGIALIAFLIFSLIPWYGAYKRRRELGRWSEEKFTASLPSMRFEAWLERQNAPVTYSLLALLGLVFLTQKFSNNAISQAGLVKQDYLAGEWWRLFTAPLLHGNLVHILMNGSAMLYLGRRIEVFARWPHLPMVFLFAAVIGGETSVRFLSENGVTVGASGGLMGWLGFLLVFETLHARLVPRHARRRLLAGVFLTALIGLIGYRFIDNAAHAGGLLAGMAYAAIVFPKSSSALRPSTTLTDRIGGVISLLVLVLAAGFAIMKML